MIALVTVFPFLLAQAEIDPDIASQALLTAIETGQWWLALGPALALVVWLLRAKLAPSMPALDAFLQKPVVAFLTPVVVAFLGGVVNLGVTGQLTSPKALLALLPSVLKVAFTAIATYVGIKKVAEQRELAKAKAEATIPAGNTQAAVDTLVKPPNPGEP